MKRLATAATIALCLAVSSSPASASKPRCKLERIDPSGIDDGKIKLYANVIELEGDVTSPPPPFTLLVNGKPQGRPVATTSFKGTGEKVDVVLVVETAAQFKQALDDVKQALEDFLGEQPPTIRVLLLTYGSAVENVTHGFFPTQAISSKIDDLEIDEDSGDVQMGQAIRMAIVELKKLDAKVDARTGRALEEGEKAPPRRLIVLVSDGLNEKMDRATFKQIGNEARKADIPIHTIAYSPIDSRGPLLNLGDLSKRSLGTFRWAQKKENLKDQLDNLGKEVAGQYVLTFNTKVKDKELSRTNFSLACGELRSNAMNGLSGAVLPPASHGWISWVLIVLGALVGLLVVLFIVGKLLQARSATPPQPGVVQPAAMPAGGRVQPQQARAASQQMPVAAAPVAGRGKGPVAMPKSALLIGVTGPYQGQRLPIPLNARITFGKQPGHTITINDATVSANHCQLFFDGQGFTVVDLGSTNGTFVNSARIAAPTRINDGDLLRLGNDTQFKLRVDY